MRAFMDDVDVTTAASGTTVVLRRRLRNGSQALVEQSG
jgi:hypothetical protein